MSNFEHEGEVWTQSGIRKSVTIAATQPPSVEPTLTVWGGNVETDRDGFVGSKRRPHKSPVRLIDDIENNPTSHCNYWLPENTVYVIVDGIRSNDLYRKPT